ncbi:uncharacterized protein LOC144911394 [Branchiostoma floridae x Branchiostoma belcheri]
MSPDPDPAQTLANQGYGELLEQALNYSAFYPDPTGPPPASGYIFGADWSSASSTEDLVNMLQSPVGPDDLKLQLFVRSTLIDILSARMTVVDDMTRLHQATTGVTKLLGTGEFVYIEKQVSAVEALHEASDTLQLSAQALGRRVDDEQVLQIAISLYLLHLYSNFYA